MKRRFRLIMGSLVVCILTLFSQFATGQGSQRVVGAQGYLSAEAVRAGDAFKVAVVLKIAEGYHINAHVPSLEYLVPTSVTFEAPAGMLVGEPQYPAASKHTFAFAPETPLSVHEGSVVIVAEGKAESWVSPGSTSLHVRIKVQACDSAQCLAPASLNLEIPVQIAPVGQPVREINSEVFSAENGRQALSGGPATVARSLAQFGGAPSKNAISDMIESRGLLVTLLFVFLSGLALNTTPCVYPIIPITIGFFANQSEGRLRKTFLMASAYVLGMATTYSVLGVVASLSKGLFGAALQKPPVLIGLAVLMVLLALSMFGVYEFRLPTFLNRLATKTTQSRGGILGALTMGLMMGIVAAPCIGPFVLGLLVHVGAKGDPIYGFFLFFVLALGLGLPFLVLGTFSGTLKSLPRAGEWMVTVRKVFGLILLGMAIYFLMPLLGRFSTHVLIGFLAAAALYLIFWEANRARPKQFSWILRVLGAGAALTAVMMAIPSKVEGVIAWQPFSQEALADAQRQGKPAIVDVFADWCIPCKELDKVTFASSAVLQQADGFVWLKLDLTHDEGNSDAARARDQFGIRGVPTVLFFDPQGREKSELRLEGFEEPEAFIARMKQALAQTR